MIHSQQNQNQLVLCSVSAQVQFSFISLAFFNTKITMADGRQRRESPTVGLLLEALASSSSLIRTRRPEDFGVLDVPHPQPLPHHAYTGNPFRYYEEQQDVLQSSFIGFFPWIKRILWYFFMGMMLLMSSLCIYGGTVRQTL
jgi:hypothetical protein